MAYAFVQAVEGSRVTSGTTITTTLTVTATHFLVAVISRQTASGSVPTIGEVKGGGYWRQAVEFDSAVNLLSGTQAADIWYCENATGGSTTVTATLVGSPNNTINGMNMQILEYSGNSGYELIDQIGQALITTTSITVTTNFNLAASNDLGISVVCGNQSVATVPSGWNSRLADTTQKFWVADNTAVGSSGSTLSAAWTSLTGATRGSAILVTFKQVGATTGPTLLQISMTDAAFPTLPPVLTWTSQAYPVNPTPGNVLLAFVQGIIQGPSLGYTSNLLSCRAQSITDTASNTWLSCGESGVDNTSGVCWTLWLCRQAKGGTTTLTATYNQPVTSGQFILMEFQGLPPNLVVDGTASVTGRNTAPAWTATTPGSIAAGDLAVATMSSLPDVLNHPASGWTQIFSDTSGSGWTAMQLATAAGALTVTWSGGPFLATDILLVALKSASGVGSH